MVFNCNNRLFFSMVLLTAFSLIDADGAKDGKKTSFVNEKQLPVFERKFLQKDIAVTVGGLQREDLFYGKNISLLNSCNDMDKIFYFRHSIDINCDCTYGWNTYGYPVAQMYLSVRDKGLWGNPGSIAQTVDAATKDLDVVGEPHRHAIPRHFFWIRESWLQCNLNEALDLHFYNPCTFTIGAFPFELGRGIALGSAYTVAPESLGFNPDTAIDQYAFGMVLHGGLIPHTLSYDLYMGVLQNKTGTLSDTGEKVRAQEYGRIDNPARGFGIINCVFAGRVRWNVFLTELGSLELEPYVMYNNDPEQRVEFLADASAKLGTFGCAGEFSNEFVELGFDYAVNVGRQKVRGWDRNAIVKENRNGFSARVNSHVLRDGKKVLHMPGSVDQSVINSSAQDESQNGKEITSGSGLINADNRFRDPYTNRFEGWMFVADGLYKLYNDQVKIAGAVGVASGDENPNFESVDGNYRGFIGLQELYGGKRVKSAFLLGGAGKLKRPLSAPKRTTRQAPSPFATSVSGFTNLMFIGGSVKWEPYDWAKKFKLQSNVLLYWQHAATSKFDLQTGRDSLEKARRMLGGEWNVFVDYYLLKSLKVFGIFSLFVPGAHYSDIRGKPFNREQQLRLDRLDRTGFNGDIIPNIGTDSSVTFNVGLEFAF